MPPVLSRPRTVVTALAVGCGLAVSWLSGLHGTATAAAEATSDTYAWSNAGVDGGGFVPGIAFNRTEKDLVYARTDIGGAYRQDPATKKWIPLLDSVGWNDWNLTGVASLATDPVQTDRVYVAAGTYTNGWDPNNGAVLRSTDRGRTWSRTTVPFKIGGNMPGRGMGERLAVDPNDDRIVWFGAPEGNGLWKSTDYGAYFGYSGLSVDRRHPNVVMVTGYSSWWPDTQIYRSTDYGATFKPIWEYNGYPNRVDHYTLDTTTSPWLSRGNHPSSPEETPKLGWMTESLEIDPFDSDRMMYGTGATLYGTDGPDRLGRRFEGHHKADGRGPGGDRRPGPDQPAHRRPADQRPR